MYVIDRHDMTLAVKVALNPNTINQPMFYFQILQSLGEKDTKLESWRLRNQIGLTTWFSQSEGV